MATPEPPHQRQNFLGGFKLTLEHLGRFERTLRAATSAQATEALGRLEVCVAGMLIALSSFATGG